MKLETCLHVAARIWCDKEFEHITMDGEAAMAIAKILFFVAESDETRKQNERTTD